MLIPPDNKIVKALKNPDKPYIIDVLVNFRFANQRFHLENTPVATEPVNKPAKCSESWLTIYSYHQEIIKNRIILQVAKDV